MHTQMGSRETVLIVCDIYVDTHDVYVASDKEARGGKGLPVCFIYKGLVDYNTTTVKTFANGVAQHLKAMTPTLP